VRHLTARVAIVPHTQLRMSLMCTCREAHPAVHDPSRVTSSWRRRSSRRSKCLWGTRAADPERPNSLAASDALPRNMRVSPTNASSDCFAAWLRLPWDPSPASSISTEAAKAVASGCEKCRNNRDASGEEASVPNVSRRPPTVRAASKGARRVMT